MTDLSNHHQALFAALSDGPPQHVSQLTHATGMKPQQLDGFQQQIPGHTRGLLRQRDGQWRLARLLAVFAEESLQQMAGKHGFRAQLRHERSPDSNEIIALARRSAGLTHKALCAAHFQTRGRERQGRSWVSRQDECLMFSLGWAFDRPQYELGSLALVVTLACHRALAGIGLNVNIKWPNDLVVANDKLAGVLVETTRVKSKTVAIIGIGINLVLPKKVENATSVQALFQTASKQGVSVEALLNTVLAQLGALLDEYAQNGFTSCVGEYDAANRDTSRPILLLREGRVVHKGIVKSVGVQGTLRLLTGEGERTIVSGEISSHPDSRPARPTTARPERFLSLDGSNSQLKWTWMENGTFSEVGRASYRGLTRLDEEWLRFADEGVKIVGCIVYGSVKRAIVEEQLTRPVGWLSSMPQALGVRNRYHRPEEHGSDRWFNTLGSRHFAQNVYVVASCGTAVIADALAEDDHYLDGTIMPGFHLMKEAMALKTADLNRPIGRVYPFPTTTPNTIASGMMGAVCGALVMAHGRLKNKTGGGKPVDIIITGDGVARIMQVLPEVFIHDDQVKIVDDLMIYGLLHWIAHRNGQ